MTYASSTKVPVERSRNEIESVLKKYGASKFAYFTEDVRAIIIFEAVNRRIRFDLPLPIGESVKDQQKRRACWRALLLCIKAKLESVESNIETFEEAFLSHVVMPDGMTVGQHTRPMISQAYKEGKMVPLLPSPKSK